MEGVCVCFVVLCILMFYGEGIYEFFLWIKVNDDFCGLFGGFLGKSFEVYLWVIFEMSYLIV